MREGARRTRDGQVTGGDRERERKKRGRTDGDSALALFPEETNKPSEI